jgi:two-component system sensor histidine kinase KdpD
VNRPAVAGVLAALALTAVLTAVLMALRPQLNGATSALVLVVPVVVAVSIGGFGAGLLAAGMCFLVYDFVFLPPYYTLYVRRDADWVALGVYAAVAPIVARVVAAARSAREESQRRAADVRRLFDVSELLVRELPVSQLLESIVSSLRSAFDLEGVSLLLPVDGQLQPVAAAGEPLPPEEAAHLSAGGAEPVSLRPVSFRPVSFRPVSFRPVPRRPGPTERILDDPFHSRTLPGRDGSWQAVALVAGSNAVGLLAVRGASGARDEQELLRAFANHLALALERATLQEEALRARLLGEVDLLRRSLVGAVSHDLRTPLATIKLSASTLLESGSSLTPGDVKELASLVDAQADRLDRLVSNLLDMTRIQAGALELRRQPCSVADLVDEALAVLGRSGQSGEVSWQAPADLALVDVDPVLVRQALANLVDNAFSYSPERATVTVAAREVAGQKVEVSVSDKGPGVPEEERTRIFQMFERREAGGRGGLGLAITQAFIEAHGERIWVGPADGGGARFAFTLPMAREA